MFPGSGAFCRQNAPSVHTTPVPPLAGMPGIASGCAPARLSGHLEDDYLAVNHPRNGDFPTVMLSAQR